MTMVFLLSERGDHDDGGDRVVGVFSSRAAAMAAVPGRSWESWSDERRGSHYVRIDVGIDGDLPDGWSTVRTTSDEFEIEPWTLDDVTIQR